MIRHAIYSLSTKTAKPNYGWLAEKYFWYGLATSVFYSKKIFETVVFYSDATGCALADKFGIQFTTVNDFLEAYNFPKSLWCLPKIWAIKQQYKPFIHIDPDVFLTKTNTLSREFLGSEVIVQSKEPMDSYEFYQKSIKRFKEEKYDLTKKFLWGIQNNIDPVNCGIIGGNNLNIFQKHWEDVFSIVEMNREKFGDISEDGFCVTLEQWLLAVVCEFYSVPITTLLKHEHSDEAAQIGYKHWLAQSKRSQEKSMQVEGFVQKNMPEQYDLINKHFEYAATIQ